MKKGGFDRVSVIPAWGACFAILALASGCAYNRGQIELKMAETPNPATGTAVKFLQVTDNRRFEAAPTEPSIPSLKDGAISNSAITSRAVARKRNWMGIALGDVLLPPGRTVTQMAREALTRALREAGYRVLGPEDADYGRAVPLTVSVNDFWAWSTVANLEFKTDIRIEGNIEPLRGGLSVQGKARKSLVTGSNAEWMQVITMGLEDLNKNVKAKLGRS